jgi:hypothetical protein
MPGSRLTILSLTLVLSGLLLACWLSAPSLPSLRGDEAIDSLKQQGLYDSLQQAMDRTRYRISLESDSKNSQVIYRAPNPAQGFDALFTRHATSIQPRQPADKTAQRPSWQTALSLIGYGYKNDFVILSAHELEALDNRIELRHESVDGTGRSVTEWYVNRAEGLEQGFVIHAQPSDKIEGEKLRVAMKLSGDLKAETTGDGQAISFSTPTGTETLRYEKLFVTDAASRKLAAQMRVEAGELWLEVEDGDAAYPLTIDPVFVQQAKLLSIDGDRFDRFGHSVAISGETAIIGAPGDGFGDGSSVGAAFVFVRNGATWTQQAELTANDATEFDVFGSSVAISGETVVVGASEAGPDQNSRRGAAYVFVRNGATWTQQAKITASDGVSGDQFGGAVAIEGETIAVGAPAHNAIFFREGAVYVFVRTGATWTQQAKFTASDAVAEFFFGNSLSISGNTLAVGASLGDSPPGGDTGAAYVFVRTGTTWTQQAKLAPGELLTGDRFGISVSISGETIAVGAPFHNTSAGVDAGAAYVFVRTGTTWIQQAKLTANDGEANTLFGWSAAIYGETAIIGSRDNTSAGENAGAAYVFVRTGTTWTQQAKLTPNDGMPFQVFSLSVAISGETIVIGAPNDTTLGTQAGAAYVFACSGPTTWTRQAKAFANDRAPFDNFAISVAISGETAVIGAWQDDTTAGTDAGSAYVFVRTGNSWTEQAQLTALIGGPFDKLGKSVAVNGETAVIGAPRVNLITGGEDAGSAYVFVRMGSSWSQQAQLTASSPSVFDNFGNSVAISGETVIVGSPLERRMGIRAGSAYVFVRTGSSWSEQARLAASEGAENDQLGNSVAISGETVVAGAPHHNPIGGTDAGAAYIFNSSCISPPTAVGLSSFTASAYDEGVSLEWATGFEVSNLGFNLYRDEGGKRTTINSSLIAGSALLVGSSTRLSAGRSYAWWDNAPADLKKSQYWVEAVDLDGSTQWFGPVTVKFVGGYAPDRSQAALLARRGYLQSGITAPLTRSAIPHQVTQFKQTSEADPALLSAIKIAVKTEGWYRIAQPELVRAGLDPKIDPRYLQLFVDGRQLPISVTGEQDGRLDADDAVEFYAVGLDTASTDARVHWLARGPQFGLRIATVESKGVPSNSVGFPYTVERRDRTIYFSSLLNGEHENFFGPVITSVPVDQSLALRHIVTASSEQATLEVSLQGVTKVAHNVHVSLNGTNVGAVVFNDQAAGIAKLNVPHSMLKEGANQITLISVAGNSDVSLVDYVRLTYSHRFTAESNYLRFTIPANRQFTIDGFSNDRLRLLDVTDINRVQEVRASISRAKNGYSISATAAGEGERILVALTAEQARTPVSVTANQPSRLRQSSNGADLIVITRAQFASSLAPLIALRQRQGFAVLVVDIEDIYDEFSFGQKSPEAIKDFLAYAGSSWKRRPGYVLFGGDASLDPRDYLGLGDWDFVPTGLIDTRYMETASDDYLADFDGDSRADLAVGRLPFRTVDEATRMVSKIIRYETSSPAESVLIASDSDDQYSFEAASAQLKSLVPARFRVEEVRRGQLDDLTAKSEMIKAINRGQKIVNYIGHGSVDMWRGGMLTSTDIVKLNNEDRLALFVMMTCLNGYFQDTTLDSLAESLLKAERGGAVAVWASSAMTVPDGQAVINRELYRLLFTPAGQSLRLGEATRRAKAAIGDSDITRSWILFGDPTMRLK